MDKPDHMSEPALDSWALIFAERHWKQLNSHLFPGDNDEHAAVLLAGLAAGKRGLRLLVREVILATDGIDYVPGTRGYRALSPSFIARAARRAKAGGWAYLAVHCHGGSGKVAFSNTDLKSHERGYPALRDLIGRPVGGLVLADNAAAGDLWIGANLRSELSAVRVVGDNVVNIVPALANTSPIGQLFDRQARMFGIEGQRVLENLRVAVVGLGGAGSMAAEMLMRLGIGELVFVDPDNIDPTNLSRIVGSTLEDALPPTAISTAPAWKPKAKVQIASDYVRRSGFRTLIETYATDVADPACSSALANCDWIVLAADSNTARHVVNAVSHAYLVPVIQVGVKIPVDAKSGQVGDIFCVARHITPDAGCLWCNGLINATDLQIEAIGEDGVRARAYVGPDAPAPSVITLNGLAVSLGMTELLLSAVGLLAAPVMHPRSYQRHLPRSHSHWVDEARRDPSCMHCGESDISLFAKGDDAILPKRPQSLSETAHQTGAN